MGFNLQAGNGAGAGADMLQSILKQKALEFAQQQAQKLAEAKLAEDARQANLANATTNRGQDLSHEVGMGGVAVGNRNAATSEGRLAQDQTEFNAGEPQRLANVRLLGAQTGEIERKPQAEQEQRDFTTGRDRAQHGYQMGEIGAQGQNALAVANVRHPEATGPTQQQQNEVQDTLALIDQIGKDPALNKSVGPIDQYVGGVISGDPAGVNRFRNLHNELSGKLQLAQAGKLKGQGQISDKERAMLAAAATALNPNTSEKDYRAELQKIRGQFERMANPGAAGPAVGATIRARDQQGNLHEAPAGTALPAGWKLEGGG